MRATRGERAGGVGDQKGPPLNSIVEGCKIMSISSILGSGKTSLEQYNGGLPGGSASGRGDGGGRTRARARTRPPAVEMMHVLWRATRGERVGRGEGGGDAGARPPRC